MPARFNFHTTCVGIPIDESSGEPWRCGRCSGRDKEVCAVCNKEWFVTDTSSWNYTGEVLHCAGNCDRWFHQVCHNPPVMKRPAKSRQRSCASCKHKPAPRMQPTKPNDSDSDSDPDPDSDSSSGGGDGAPAGPNRRSMRPSRPVERTAPNGPSSTKDCRATDTCWRGVKLVPRCSGAN